MLSISTSWNSSLETNWEEWLTQIKSVGLNAIELSYTLNRHQLETIKKLIKPMGIKVSSIHSFCPIPDDEPSDRHVSNYYRLSSLNDHERMQAAKWTKVCIDTAKEVGAGVVVIHAGTLEWEDDPSRQLIKMFKQGEQNTTEFDQIRRDFIKQRLEKRTPYLSALEISLLDVVRYAQRNNIKIGLETRYYPIEIPNFDEVGFFLDKFEAYGMHYWHDVGHAELNDQLGLSSHIGFLERYQSRMIGIHLHGIRETRDHLAPFDGDMKLEKVFPYIKKDFIKVIESRYASVDQIKFAIEKLSYLNT